MSDNANKPVKSSYHNNPLVNQGISPDTLKALIPPGLRPELTLAIALWIGGASILKAAKQAGCPKTTLYEHTLRLSAWAHNERPKIVDESIKLHHKISTEAGRQLLERVVENGEDMKTTDLNYIYGTSADKEIGLMRVMQLDNTGPASPLDNLLDRLGKQGGGSLTLSVEPNHTIDVTPDDA